MKTAENAYSEETNTYVLIETAFYAAFTLLAERVINDPETVTPTQKKQFLRILARFQ